MLGIQALADAFSLVSNNLACSCICTEPLKSMQCVLVIRNFKAEFLERGLLSILFVCLLDAHTWEMCLYVGVQMSKENIGCSALSLS